MHLHGSLYRCPDIFDCLPLVLLCPVEHEIFIYFQRSGTDLGLLIGYKTLRCLFWLGIQLVFLCEVLALQV